MSGGVGERWPRSLARQDTYGERRPGRSGDGGNRMALDAEAAARWLADQHGLRYVDLSHAALAPGASLLLPEPVARQLGAVPMGRRLGTPVIAVTDPGDAAAMEALRAEVGREYVAVVARPDHIAQATTRLYRSDGPLGRSPAPDAAGPGTPGQPGGTPPGAGTEQGGGTAPVPGDAASGRGGSLEESLRHLLVAPAPSPAAPAAQPGAGRDAAPAPGPPPGYTTSGGLTTKQRPAKGTAAKDRAPGKPPAGSRPGPAGAATATVTPPAQSPPPAPGPARAPAPAAT
ncbi:MAG: hypothetical protein ACRDWN_10380, partial [Acidimicrobiales bacterium]